MLPCPHILAETSALAEELVFEHYGLSSRLLRSLQYEARFLREGWPFPEEALAVLVRGQRPRGPEPYCIFFPYGRPLPCSRAFLPALMLYIFTHELVHMVRFVRYEVPYHLRMEKREEEEIRVHAKAREILSPLAHWPGLAETLERFDRIYLRKRS
ncbi:MAG: hypothetical protein DSZ24_04690 [Thermodesulfatator sp.]|nr:MAG: hypothetical protein DSZ24_04690 [Thermodesulfatator sp.]